MRPIKTAIMLFSLLPLLQACGGSGNDSKVTETRMDDLDSVEGTISDDMVNTDQSTDEAPIDASAPADAKPKAKSDDAKPKDDAKTEMKVEDKAPKDTAKITPTDKTTN